MPLLCGSPGQLVQLLVLKESGGREVEQPGSRPSVLSCKWQHVTPSSSSNQCLLRTWLVPEGLMLPLAGQLLQGMEQGPLMHILLVSV